jgi:7,8-dihydroneopterin aldolase/epimerase/oxygenase
METVLTGSATPLLDPSFHPRPDALPLDDAARPLDLILIEGFRGETVIGIHDTELHRPQPIVIDLQAGLPRARACDTDRIADTIDYSVVRDRLRTLLREHRLQLLEAFAETIAQMLIHDFGASWVRVKVIKPHKFDDLNAVGVQIERRAPPPDATRQATVLQLLGAGMVPGGR